MFDCEVSPSLLKTRYTGGPRYAQDQREWWGHRPWVAAIARYRRHPSTPAHSGGVLCQLTMYERSMTSQQHVLICWLQTWTGGIPLKWRGMRYGIVGGTFLGLQFHFLDERMCYWSLNSLRVETRRQFWGFALLDFFKGGFNNGFYLILP